MKVNSQPIFVMISTFVFAAVSFYGCKKDSQPQPELVIANFTYSGEAIPAPTTISFKNTSTNAVRYVWTFDDGLQSQEKDPQHTYTKGGIYHVKLHAISEGGQVADITIDVNIKPTWVYVVGYDDISPVFWKNNVADVYPFWGEHKSVFVSDTNVYIAGRRDIFSSWTYEANLYKNGVSTTLSSGIHKQSANSVFVSGSDVYVAGISSVINPPWDDHFATIWKNGVATTFPPAMIGYYSECKSIYVSGSDVYAVGITTSSSGVNAVIWKNGMETLLTNNCSSCNATSVFVSGMDVYVAGSVTTPTNSNAVIWINGAQTILASNGISSNANSLYVAGTDVYVAGNVNDGTKTNATVWKNGIATNLSNGQYSSSANSVFVSGAEVYVAGNINRVHSNHRECL